MTINRRGKQTSLAALAETPQFTALSIYEPGISGAYRKFLSGIPDYHNSFMWDNSSPGDVVNGVPHQDLMQLSFEDERFDLVISSDIFEHVRRPWEAFVELHRVLRPGGMHIFSVPALTPMPSFTTFRVDTSGEEDVHIKEPYYHGDGKGGRSLVYTEFGSDLIDTLRDIGFTTYCLSNDHTDTERCRVISFASLKFK